MLDLARVPVLPVFGQLNCNGAGVVAYPIRVAARGDIHL